MSGDSTFGISNTEAALSSSKDSDEADESVDDLSQKTSSQSDLSAAEVAKWRAEKEKRVKDLFATLKDDSLDQSVPEWPGTSRTSRWRQPRNQDGGGAARSSEHFNVSENNSIDAVEEQIRSRRRPFSNGQRRKSSAADVAAAFNDTTDDENAPVVYKKPLPFAQRRQTARKPSVPDPNAFNETHSSVEEEKPVRRTRGGFSKRPKSIPNPEFFDTTDESVVVEPKAKKLTRSARQVTEANMKAFEVTDDEEEEEEDVGGEDERAKETREGEDYKEGKGTRKEDEGKENTVLEEEGGNGSEFVLELDEEGSVDKAEEEARNSMDESDESEAEEEGGNKSVSLVVQSEGEVGGEDSLGEDVDEDGEEEEKEVDDEEGKQVVGSAKSGGKGDQDKVEQKNRDGGVGSSNEQSSLLLEYHLSVENQSVVIESHNKSSASLKSSASMTMDITLASRRSRSRRFTQQFLEMDKTGEGLPNLGKILDGVDVMNMSAKNLMEPIVGEALRISPLTEVAVSDKNDRSLRSRDNSAVSEKNNRSLRSRDDSGVSDRNNRSLRSGNRSVNKSNSGVSNENNKSLRSGSKPVVEKELNSSGKSGKKRSSAAKELFIDRGESDVVATIDVINDSQRDEGGVGNRSLRNRRGRGDANKSVAEKDSSKENVESGDVSMEVDNVMYNSLDSIRVDPLKLPQTDVNASAIVNNSLNSTVNATRADQNSSNRGLDEIMPAPRSLPARKRRLVAPTGGTPSFSLAAQKKKKKPAEGESDSVAALVEREKENDQVAVNGNREVVAAKVNYKCPKLKKPEVWVTPRLYKWLIEKLEPRYKLRSRLRAEEFVDLLCSTVKTVIKKEENYEKEVEDLKYEMARLNMVENLHEFFIFISEFLPWRFQDKSIPLPQAFITGKAVTYEKGTLYDPIL